MSTNTSRLIAGLRLLERDAVPADDPNKATAAKILAAYRKATEPDSEPDEGEDVDEQESVAAKKKKKKTKTQSEDDEQEDEENQPERDNDDATARAIVRAYWKCLRGE